MTQVKMIGLTVGALLLFGYEPIAEATPAAAPGSAVGVSASEGLVMTVGHYRRVARRTTRRAVRRHIY
jgi:hypothetical protein